jgi:2-oxoisovalerate dehydrogenase E1 component
VYEDVPEGYYNLPIGKGCLLQGGTDVSIITYGQGVHWALNHLKENPDISADVIDLRTLMPLDTELIYESVQKTGRALILQEDCLFGGISSDISSLITENCFTHLDAPVKRVGSLDTPVPFAKELEDGFLPAERWKEDLEKLLRF